jgi:iron complex outermembrane receptor protein
MRQFARNRDRSAQPKRHRLLLQNRLGVQSYFPATSLAFILLSATGAYAQVQVAQNQSAAAGSGPSPAAPSDQAAPEEIIVTARRHGENVEKVPVSVTAFGAAQLEQRSIRSEEDLQTSVPGLTIRATASQNQLQYSIRGQTVDLYSGSSTAIVPYINEVQANSGGAALFFDLDSIQVLKGPQGTLFGRNATGGAVLYTTVKPTNEFEGYLDGQIGNYDYLETQGALNIPIVDDKVLLRVAFDVASRNGYVYNLYDRDHEGALDRQSGRFSLVLRPTDDIENTTVVEVDHSGGSNTGTALYAVNKCGTTNGGFALNCIADSLYSPLLDKTVGVPGAFAAYLAAHPNAPAGGILAFLAQQQRMGPWTVDQDGGDHFEEFDYFVSNTTTFDLAPDAQIKNIFGATRSHTNSIFNQTGDPYGIEIKFNPTDGDSGEDADTTAISDELNIQGKTLEQTLTYIVGVYFLDTTAHGLYPYTNFNISPIILPTSGDFHFTTDDVTEAIYAQGTYDLGSITGIEGLSFTGGFRYSWEQVSLDQLQGGVYFPAPHEEETFSNPSWQLGLEYQLTPDLLAYVEGRRSWRTGGLNPYAPPIQAPASGGGNVFYPEYTRDVEIGVKFGGTVYGHAVHLNLAAYNQWVDNLQRSAYPSIGGHLSAVTINVPAAEITGLELDAAVKPTDWLEIGAAGSLTDPRFTQNRAVVFGQLYVFGPYPDAPRSSGTLFAEVTLPTDQSVGDMTVRADLYAQTGQYFSSTNNTITPGTRLPGYALINLRYDWSDMFGSPLSLGAFVKNLTNRQYYIGGYALGAAYGVDEAIAGTPRMFGAELKYRFGPSGAVEETASAYVPPPVAAPAPAPKSYLVFFDFNKSDLTPQATTIVDQAAANAGPAKVTQIEVTGHTDTVGSDAYNMRLSRRRAESVAAQLEKDGIPSSEIELFAKGKRDLLVPTGDGVKEPQNRRVQIVFSGEATS